VHWIVTHNVNRAGIDKHSETLQWQPSATYLHPILIQYDIRKVLYNGHRRWEVGQHLLQSFRKSNQSSCRWFHSLHLPQSYSMHCISHSTDCVQGTDIGCSHTGIPYCWGTHLVGGEIKWLVVEWTGTLVELHHSCDDWDRLTGYSSGLEPWLICCLAVQTSEIVQTLRARTQHVQCICVLETYARQIDGSFQIMQATWFVFFYVLHNITLTVIERHLQWGNNKWMIRRCKKHRLVDLLSSQCTFQHWKPYAVCRLFDTAMLTCHLCIDGWLCWKHSFSLNQAAPVPTWQTFEIVVGRREFIVMAIERLSAIFPNHDTCNAGRKDR